MMSRVRNLYKRLTGLVVYYLASLGLLTIKASKVSLCGGPTKIPGYFNIDLQRQADLSLDLEHHNLPFKSSSVDTVLCISAVNYFTRERGEQIIKEVHRILSKDGIARFAVQDLHSIAQKYVAGDKEFFFQKLPSGKDRFLGVTMADKINSWFYGYKTIGGKAGKYFYDFETLALLFQQAGFSRVEQKAYLESELPNIESIDNRPDQMFFLEAIK